jgi:hypothetical protein|tara:strand:- start:3359 stop:3772 length:414 start_codon:yes stop_codon:yes gene_type:complete
MNWYFEDKLFAPTEEELSVWQGFVYEIEENDTGMKYIGKKYFWKPKILPVTKTRKRRKKTLVQSDWKDYFGSNKLLKENVSTKSVFNYNRKIIRLCETKGECSYYEALYQFQYSVILRDDYYNEYIQCRIHSKHLKS